MGFLRGRGWLHKSTRDMYEIETVARMRRAGDHPSIEIAIRSFNAILRCMEAELANDAKGLPRPHKDTVEDRIRKLLAPIAPEESDAAEPGEAAE